MLDPGPQAFKILKAAVQAQVPAAVVTGFAGTVGGDGPRLQEDDRAAVVGPLNILGRAKEIFGRERLTEYLAGLFVFERGLGDQAFG